MSDELIRTADLMGTVVTIHVAGHGENEGRQKQRNDAVDRAVDWFRQIETICTRFDAVSELMQLSAQIGRAVPVSEILFEAAQFAVRVAEETDGAFDPTIGHRMETRGFNREFRSGQPVSSSTASAGATSYRDVQLNPEQKTITLVRPLVLDLGAVAKGLAIDMAARELASLQNFLINAGGDIYTAGHNPKGQTWSVGIRHPREPEKLIDTLRVSDMAVCTSGDYERRAPDEIGGHHILDPRSGISPNALASATVLAPSAMVADVLATAAFVLGPTEGIRLLERHGVDGLLITPTLERFTTAGLHRYRSESK